MKNAIYAALLLAAGAAVALQWPQLAYLLEQFGLVLGIVAGWALRGLGHNVALALAVRIIASRFGKKAALELLADGLRKMEAK